MTNNSNTESETSIEVTSQMRTQPKGFLQLITKSAIDAIHDFQVNLGEFAQEQEPESIDGLASPSEFFRSLRENFGALTQPQVDGYNIILGGCAKYDMPLSHTAYILATAYWETNRTIQPVREAYWVSENWRRRNLRYYPWYGRGYVQLTWEANYRKMGSKIGVDLIASPDSAMDAAYAAEILIVGMRDGDYNRGGAGPGLSGYLSVPLASYDEFCEARRTVNIMDHAADIAKLAKKFQGALWNGEWRP